MDRRKLSAGSSDVQGKLKEPAARGHTSVAHVTDDWYIVCLSKRLRRKPLAATILGTPLVIFRGRNGEAGALLDRCPHRNIPLSLGTVQGELLECCYHGWQFDRQGECQVVPGLCDDQKLERRHVKSYRIREQDGFVWVYADADREPVREPFRFDLIGEMGYTTVREELAVESSVHAVSENALDVPHTAYLHGGLFRTSHGKRSIIEVVIRRSHDSVEAEYIGEARPAGLIGRLLAPHEGTVSHIDRFILPSITQVEYRLGEKVHLSVVTALTPVHDFSTHVFAVVNFRLPIPGWLVMPLVRPIVMRIFRQDARILKQQTDTIRHFGGEQYNSSEVDVLGPHIYRLLKQAERGQRSPSEAPYIRRTRMMI